MAPQSITIAKIGGEASLETLRQFRHWSALRKEDTDPNEWKSEQWSADTRQSADLWGDRLRANGHVPPVIFFAEYVDMWSYCPPARHLGEHGLICMCADRNELFCLPLPLSTSVADELLELSLRGQWHGDRLFGQLTLHAAESWQELVDQAVLVFLRRVYRASVEDREIVNSLAGLPGWMREQQG